MNAPENPTPPDTHPPETPEAPAAEAAAAVGEAAASPGSTAAPAEDSTAAAVAPAGEDLEVVRKVYARDVRPKERLHTVFRATRKARHVARSGKPFLVLSLTDRTGELDARVFEQAESADALFADGDYLLVEGNTTVFHGKPQLVIDRLQKLDPEPLDPAEFEYTPPPPEAAAAERPAEPQRAAEPPPEVTGRGAVALIRALVERVQDPYVRKLLLAFLDDPEVASLLPGAPAAKTVHHAYRTGLAEHILSVMRLSQRLADHYPMADRDLLLAGALLHDLYKVKELAFSKGEIVYTDEGRLVGHIVMAAQKIREHASAIPDFPPLLEQHLTHLVLAHHGEVEFGSPKVPVTLEAFLVHAIDSIDARVASWLEAMARDDSPGSWTETVRLYERNLWKAAPPTTRGRSPVEGRKRRAGEPRRERQRTRGARDESATARPPRAERPEGAERPARAERPEGAERPARAARPPRPERPPRADRPERAPSGEGRRKAEGPKESAPRLSFKPLAELAAHLPHLAAPPAQEEKPPAPPVQAEATPSEARAPEAQETAAAARPPSADAPPSPAGTQPPEAAQRQE